MCSTEESLVKLKLSPNEKTLPQYQQTYDSSFQNIQEIGATSNLNLSQGCRHGQQVLVNLHFTGK